MLLLKHISRTYTPKKGVPIQALKDINLSLEDKGMVFVLGKSGSGKSTLLNLIGGLDFADIGEIVIDGKSTKDFKQSDYDNYRNTYIGFVFQEYNILSECTVGENISLALELQSQKGNKERLEDILKEVDLEGYADRKPNELSGGQKQRVAIARAIIKDPKIVMADEPTGALDSETGKAIFDTLKGLSKDRLVIVVSHDRDFAEQYGDRIIELADGEVINDERKGGQEGSINDITNTQRESKDIEIKKSHLPYKRALAMGAKSMRTKPLRLVITIILCVISFAFFGLADTIASYNTTKATIKSIMANDYDTLAVATDNGALSSDIIYLKGKTGVEFVGVETYGDSTQVLPLIYSKKLNGSNGDRKYYNGNLCGYLPADKIIDGTKYKLIAGNMPKEDFEIVVSKYTYEQFALGGIRLTDGNDVVYIEPEEIATLQNFVDKAYLQLESNEIWKVVGVVDTLADPQGRYASLKPNADNGYMSEKEFEMLSGECSQYFNYSFHSLGYVTQKMYEKICNVRVNESLLGIAARGSLTVSGENSDYTDAFTNVLDDTMLVGLDIVWADGKSHNSLENNEFVIGENMLKTLGKDISQYIKIDLDATYFDGIVDFASANITLGSLKDIVGMVYCICEYAQKADYITIKRFEDFINGIGDGQDSETKQMLRAVAIKECFESIPFIESNYEIDFYADNFTDLQWRIFYAGYMMTENISFQGLIDNVDGGYINNIVSGQLSGKQLQEKFGTQLYISYLIKLVNSKSFTNAKLKFIYGEDKDLDIDPKIVGMYFDSQDSTADKYIINNIAYESAKTARTPEYSFLIAQMPQDKQTIKVFTDLHYGGQYYMQNSVTLAMAMKSDSFAKMGNIFLYLGIGLAVFSIVLMSNYISVSISSQKRQIGILRALGAKSLDVFAIFSSESFIIAILNFVLATAAAFITSHVLNSTIANSFGLQITFMLFGIRQIALILALSVGISLIASLVSIYAITNRKPIDCILDK